MPNCVFSIIIMKKFQVLSHLRSHSKNTPTRTHFARTIPRGFAPLSHLKYRTHVCDRTSAHTHVHTLESVILSKNSSNEIQTITYQLWLTIVLMQQHNQNSFQRIRTCFSSSAGFFILTTGWAGSNWKIVDG